MQKSISIREDQYMLLDAIFDDYPYGMYMTYGDLILELIKEHKEYRKLKEGVN